MSKQLFKSKNGDLIVSSAVHPGGSVLEFVCVERTFDGSTASLPFSEVSELINVLQGWIETQLL